ncbi:MAG: phosphatidate cytidylyltransferase [Acholeplasmatales bacterium]|nr:phosphatidate cytidylyltransferase [Acholeplasmatales bacterium]
MKKRIITAIILAAILIPVIVVPQLIRVFDVFVILIAILASFELVNMYSKEKPVNLAMKITNACLTLILMMSIINYFHNYCHDSLMLNFLRAVKMDMFLSPAVAIIAIFVIMMSIMIIAPNYTVADVGKFFISIMYIGVCTGAVTVLRYFGVRFIVYLAGITVFTDIFALVFGMALGKHKMAPVTSPKKTWEGAIGGSLIATVCGTLVIFLYPYYSNLFHPEGSIEFFEGVFRYGEFTLVGKIFSALFLSLFMSACSQIGDLVASKLKRTYGIKDYSNIFPGHGGVLDRFDSLFFASAVFLIFLLIEMNIFGWPIGA